ncbi:GNAT family N-acetyltransferase [Nesterenkonia alba]|uniref:GNAT family N-acetyltransferase n=1 Tax=Nesterenkonia alba TaxID=515814 RepID=UPI000405C25B|nr:GNAT family N-acetyltransferase [Nesterenkonia alba]
MMLQHAHLEDARALHALREELAHWQESAGIIQWSPGETTSADFEEQVSRQEWHLVRDSGQVAAAVRILDADPDIWRDSDTAPAGYIHGLMVARAYTGQELGRRVLSAAESLIAERGHTLARLDCVASNETLRSYYRARGYTEVGTHEFPPELGWRPVTLFEKNLPD